MKLRAERYTIRLPRPFRIAHGTSDQRETILVQVKDPRTGLIGFGEGALPPYYPSIAEDCLQWLADREDHFPPTAAAGAVALEIAQLDLQAQQHGLPLWKWWDLDASHLPPCARTLSIPLDEAELCEQLHEGAARGSTHFKLKLGSGDLAWDHQIIRLARATLPAATFSVDANAAWSPPDALTFLNENLAYLEQPVGRDWTLWRELRAQMPATGHPPLIADESIQSVDDLPIAVGLADGVNVKLLKAGGLTSARHWITTARSLGLSVMIGVMVETGIGRTAAAQLAPLADSLDLDPPDAIPMAPLSGIRIVGDRLILSDRPGLGLEPVSA